MLSKKYNSKTTILFKILFHVIFWSVWLVMPIVNAYFDQDEGRRQHLLALTPIFLTNIPLFFINTEFLIPRILQKKEIGKYVISILFLTLIFGLIQYGLRKLIHIDNDFERNMNLMKSFYRLVFPVVFVSAVSTGFGLISYMIKQEKGQLVVEQERLQSELSFLRSQISPHFIFNVLNGIVYLIRKDAKAAEEVTIKLSELLRYMLYDAETKYVSLPKEIEYVQNYIELQKIRFGEDVAIHVDIAGESFNHQIEPMLLIPFVENAFKHGVGTIDSPEIFISIQCNASELTFMCKNRSTNVVATATNENNKGIGLKNVKRRLVLLYPKTHKIKILEKDGWFMVDLKLKFK